MCIKLLIADDEDVIRNGISKYILLHTDRFEKIYLAGNGQEAIDLILRYKPDILLLDVQMPLKNGIDVMREVKKAGIETTTIILSGYDEFKYAQQALKYGAKEYLLKPSRSSDILEALNKVADELFGTLKPNQLKNEDADNANNALVNDALEFMKEHYYEDITLTQAADQVGISAGYLSTLFTQNLKCGFIDYLNEIRIEHACTYLQQNYFKTYEIAYKVGFHDEKYFSRVFKKIKGASPSEYKKG